MSEAFSSQANDAHHTIGAHNFTGLEKLLISNQQFPPRKTILASADFQFQVKRPGTVTKYASTP